MLMILSLNFNKNNFLLKYSFWSNQDSIVANGIIGPGKRWESVRRICNGKIKRKVHVNKGDIVLVIVGDDKGKVGEVISVFPKTGRVRVKGVNLVTKHVKSLREGECGVVNKAEGVLHHSNVMHWSEVKQVRSRVGHKLVDGKNTRYLLKTGELL